MEDSEVAVLEDVPATVVVVASIIAWPCAQPVSVRNKTCKVEHCNVRGNLNVSTSLP
jgi:hypothetical protein